MTSKLTPRQQGQLKELQDKHANYVVFDELRSVCNSAIQELDVFTDVEETTSATLLDSCSRAVGDMPENIKQTVQAFFAKYMEIVLESTEWNVYQPRNNVFMAAQKIDKHVATIKVGGKEVGLKEIAEDMTNVALTTVDQSSAQESMAKSQPVPRALAVSFMVRVQRLAGIANKYDELGLESTWPRACQLRATITAGNLERSMLARAHHVVESALLALKPIAGGDKDGHVWSEGMAEDIAPKSMVDFAQAS